jgi:hypothetical protein
MLYGPRNTPLFVLFNVFSKFLDNELPFAVTFVLGLKNTRYVIITDPLLQKHSNKHNYSLFYPMFFTCNKLTNTALEYGTPPASSMPLSVQMKRFEVVFYQI